VKPANYVGGRPKDASKLSTKPEQIRRRLRRGVNRTQDMELLSQHAGFKPVDEWDYEELAYGKPRNKNGDFKGRRPSWVTEAVIREARRRLVDHTNGLLGANVAFAVRTMIKLIKSDEVDDKGRPIVDARTKIDACKFIIEHVKGKAAALVEVSSTDNVRQMIASAIVLDDGAPQDTPLVLEGEIVEEEEDDDDGE
jgi:hypothetical protein